MKLFVDGKPANALPQPAGDHRVICLVAEGEAAEAGAPWLDELRESGGGTRFESRECYDFLNIVAPDPADPEKGPERRLRAALTDRGLTLLYGDAPEAGALAERLAAGDMEVLPGHALALLLGLLTKGDADVLEDIEEEVGELEDAMMDGPPRDCVEEISGFRRRLMTLKRYYEGLFDACEDMEENVNGFLTKDELKALRLQTNRADRLSHGVLSLREYVTSVREAYQNQMDISMNRTMKFFTVLAAIFLPLQLVTGWYGMNLVMPEYEVVWVYPLVIAASLLVIIGSVWYFRRHRWF